MVPLTPTQRRIMDLLSDGKLHTKQELRDTCGNDEYIDKNTVNVYLTNLRKKIRPIGQDVVCEIHNQVAYYRLGDVSNSPVPLK